MQKMKKIKFWQNIFAFLFLPSQDLQQVFFFVLERLAMIYKPLGGKARIVFYRTAYSADEVDHKTIDIRRGTMKVVHTVRRLEAIGAVADHTENAGGMIHAVMMRRETEGPAGSRKPVGGVIPP